MNHSKHWQKKKYIQPLFILQSWTLSNMVKVFLQELEDLQPSGETTPPTDAIDNIVDRIRWNLLFFSQTILSFDFLSYCRLQKDR